MQKPFILEVLISGWTKIAALFKKNKNLTEFAPDETLAVLVPLGERIYINSILCLFYFFLKMWVMDSRGEEQSVPYHTTYREKANDIVVSGFPFLKLPTRSVVYYFS